MVGPFAGDAAGSLPGTRNRLYAEPVVALPGDQLPDCLGLIYAAPDVTRAHILRAASHQFEQGDVQHWWHQDLGLGVRTRCSDDMLWLPWTVAHYLKITQDMTILEAEVPFL